METTKCQATAKSTGLQCKLKPVKGTRYCRRHAVEIEDKDSPKVVKAPREKSKGKVVKKKLMDFKLLGELPKMAQIEVLLNLDKRDLQKMCKMNKKMAEICRQPEFRRRYLERHPEGLFHGKIKLLHVYRSKVELTYTIFVVALIDESGNKILFHILQEVRKGTSELRSVEYMNKKYNIMIKLFLHSNSTISITSYRQGSFRTQDEKKLSLKSRAEFLSSIGRPYWMHDPTSSDEFFNIIRNATKEILPWDRDMKLSRHTIRKMKILDIRVKTKAKARPVK